MTRFVCEVGDQEHVVAAETPEDAARQVAEIEAARDNGARGPRTYTVNVAEANDYDLPLIAGDDYTVTVG